MIWDLTEESEKYRKAATSQSLANDNQEFRAGDVIEFFTGYNNDIRARAEIAGTNGSDIYLVWDCYWFPIQDDERRQIKKQHNTQSGECDDGKRSRVQK